VSIGYFLSCEEFGPRELVRQAKKAEQAGFERLWISDHFHPWLDEQGNSPFVWSVIGALSETTSLPITTAVTCPLIRIHPAIVAQAAATAAVQREGRFVLGVGSGEGFAGGGEPLFPFSWAGLDSRSRSACSRYSPQLWAAAILFPNQAQGAVVQRGLASAAPIGPIRGKSRIIQGRRSRRHVMSDDFRRTWVGNRHSCGPRTPT
jgi:hypothetical protein